MNKILRYSFVALLAMLFGNAMAEETIDFTAQGYENAQEVAGYQGTDVTITFAGNGASNNPKWYNTGTAIRMYAKNSMTITSSKNIIGIAFTLDSDGLINENNEGFSTGAYDREKMLWTGSTTELTLTNVASSGNQIRLQKLVVYFEGETIPGGEEPPTPTDEVQTVSIADFNAAEVSTDVWYQLTGTVSNLKDNDQYGNFDITDETGSVYVYGLLSEKGGAKKQFQTLAQEKGIKNGCKLTLIGNRGDYNGKIEVVNAYFVSVEAVVEEVKDPEFSVPGGLYFEPQTVAMTCEEGAKILYTVAVGNDPVYVDDDNVTGVWYDGNPLNVTKSTIIKAMAVKNGKTSSIVTATYTIVNTTAKGTEADPFSVADAKAVIAALEAGATTSETYYVKGFVVGTPDIQKKTDGTYYGNANFTIADTKGGADLLTCYRLKGLNNENIESDDYIKENEEVVLVGQLQRYVKDEVETPEIKNGHIVSITGGSAGVTELTTNTLMNGVRYNLAGQVVNKGYKGLVIMNGKKFVNK